MLKIILKNKKYIILRYFLTKITLKNNKSHNATLYTYRTSHISNI